MGRIRKDDLSKPLQDAIDSRGNSSDIGNVSDLATEDKTIVGAINEIYQNISNEINGYYNNLKLVLIDEGVDVSEEDDMNSLIVKTDEEFDRQNEELNKIDDLLDTFKTNMANKGVVVTDEDDFNSLINKIPEITTGDVEFDYDYSSGELYVMTDKYDKNKKLTIRNTTSTVYTKTIPSGIYLLTIADYQNASGDTLTVSIYKTIDGVETLLYKKTSPNNTDGYTPTVNTYPISFDKPGVLSIKAVCSAISPSYITNIKLETRLKY